jgi:molecular chaperone GrpE
MTKETIDQPDFSDNKNNNVDVSIPIKVTQKGSDEPIRVTDKRFWVQPEGGNSSHHAAPSLKPSYVEELEGKLSDSQKKLDELRNSYRALKAESALETQKARERIQNEYNRRLLQAKADVARKFIDIVENLDRALTLGASGEHNRDSFLEGLRLIRGQFGTALSELGLEEVTVRGETFNPEIAEAVETVQVNNEAEDNLVLEVVSKGYRISETLVRPARVKVGIIRSAISN